MNLTTSDLSKVFEVSKTVLHAITLEMIKRFHHSLVRLSIKAKSLDPAKMCLYLCNHASMPGEELKISIAKMVVLRIERGNKYKEYCSKSSEKGKAKINALIKHFDIKANPSNDLMAVTLSLVGLAFPHITCEYMRRARNPVVVPSEIDDKYIPEMTCCFC
ncbi:Uncharacterised protein g2721 [Pycnogonum litorale]